MARIGGAMAGSCGAMAGSCGAMAGSCGALLLSLLLLLHSPGACGAPPQPRGTLCRTKPTDLVFIIDSSRSVRPHEFEKIKVFVSRVIEALDVGPNATRVGIINYASAVRSELSLQSPQSKAALLQAVRRIQPLSTGTMTGLAIQFAISRAFSAAEGGRASTPNFRKRFKHLNSPWKLLGSSNLSIPENFWELQISQFLKNSVRFKCLNSS
ncbi:hypothetical protein TURU_162169 [Turdus rufiventris]|nr:hypothetical protein TURU_162169 [Turdus rufiventris]